VAAFQKVATFRVAGGQKQGGNVASYFCLSDGTVLHAIAGPVDADVFLREARWAVDVRNLAMLESQGSFERYRDVVRRAHAERLLKDREVTRGRGLKGAAVEQLILGGPVAEDGPPVQLPDNLPAAGQVHFLLARDALPRLRKIYAVVFEQILDEKISSLPVLR
jgi:hypothetical protein